MSGGRSAAKFPDRSFPRLRDFSALRLKSPTGRGSSSTVITEQREKNNLSRSRRLLLIWLERWKRSQSSNAGRPMKSFSFVENSRRLSAELEGTASASFYLLQSIVHRAMPSCHRSSICTPDKSDDLPDLALIGLLTNVARASM